MIATHSRPVTPTPNATVSPVSARPETALSSAIYTGTLSHHRDVDVRRDFSHAVTYAYLDLEELPELASGRLTRPGPGPWRFRRRDYLAPHDVALSVAVRDRVAEALGERPAGPVRMLTQLRCFGMAFNPVTLYYCFHPDAQRLHAVLAEVTNTPWRERHAYALGPWSDTPGDGAVLRDERDKAMHVSPFLGMEERYAIRLTPPGATLSVHIDCLDPQETREFSAGLTLSRRGPLSAANLSRLIRAEPVAPLRTLTRIYRQGWALHRAGVAVRPHPDRTTT